MKISVILPCHNEADNIPNMISGLLSHYDDVISEVIIVDDASSDCTYDVAKEWMSRYPKVKVIRRTPPCGVGRALRDGFSHVSRNSDHVLMLDADFIRNVNEITPLIARAQEGVDMVVGSRFLKQRNLQGYPVIKKIVNRGFHFLVWTVLRIPYRDLTNNFKLMRREIIDEIQWQSVNFSINAETGLYPVLRGHSVCEIPVSWIQRTEGMGLSDFSVFKVAHSYAWVLMKAVGYKYLPHWMGPKIFTD